MKITGIGFCYRYVRYLYGKETVFGTTAVASCPDIRADSLQTGPRYEAAITADDSLRVAFEWVAGTLAYDPELLQNGGSFGPTEDIIDYATRTGKGVCVHYAELFNKLCGELGYEAYVVGGYTVQDGKTARLPHAWNAVKTDGRWHLYDPTWAAGYLDSGAFIAEYDNTWYKVPPEEFIATHIPNDPIWQFLAYPRLSAPGGDVMADTVYYDFEDSVRLYGDFENDIILLKRSRQRVASLGESNLHMTDYLAYLDHTIGYLTIRMAADHMSHAVKAMNTYLEAKQGRFRKQSSDIHSIMIMLESSAGARKIATTILEGYEADTQNGEAVAELYATGAELEVMLKDEFAFMEKYRNTWKPLRVFLF